VKREAGRHIQPVEFVVFGFRQVFIAFHDDYVTSGAGAASAAGMIQVDAAPERHIQHRLAFPVIAVGEFAVLKLNGLVVWKKRYLGQVPLYRRMLVARPRAYWKSVFEDIEQKLAAAVEKQLAERFQLAVKVALEQPKQSAFGELAVPVAFQLARQLRRPPRQIAGELAAALGGIEGISSLEVAGNGYINVRLDRAAFALSLLRPGAAQQVQTGGKIIVEHTNINPNKAAHIGHLRNAVLGDTFVRMLRARRHYVEVQNYIDNTGVQVADVVAGFHFLENKKPAEIEALIANPDVRFDFLCWDLYAAISAHYKSNPEALAWRAETLHAIESGSGELAEIGHLVADAVVRAHLRTMYRLGIEYDLLPRESEILHLKFWAAAFELLKQHNAIYLETEGKNEDCWVMPGSAFREATGFEEDAEGDSKVIVRSNGTVTYVGKDIAYQLWKFGLLGKDFHYGLWSEYAGGHQIWVTTDRPGERKAPAFGRGSKVFNVIDSRQAYLQDVVAAGLRALGFEQQAEASVHFSYEMVALSPRTCAEMGIELSEEDKRRSYVEVSGRKGLGVKADDLIDKLIETALAEVEDRHPDADARERMRVAEQIAVGALRYFMLKFTRNSVIAFDFHEALSFEGETGPYVQYAAVRGEAIPDFAAALTSEILKRAFENETLWQLLLLASKSGSVIERAIAAGEPAHVAKYAFQLAQAFNNFYHDQPVITEENRARRAVLLWLTGYVREQLLATLGVLGIEVPEYM
jgi:arginyl-tRNA synthetase